MGMLDQTMEEMMGESQMPQSPSQGGMMDGMMENTSSPQGNAVFIQMADAILRDPTPPTVTQVIGQLRQMGGEGTMEVAQALQQLMNNPQELTKFVGQVKQSLG